MENNPVPAISIVMPVYNAAEYLHDSMESILGQTFIDFELIVVDDGSTDNSVEIVKSYAAKDSRVVLQTNPHDFIRSLDTGIDLARGKYIARMDADDIMLPHRLETQFRYMEANPEVDVCGSWMEEFGANQQILKAPQSHDEIVSRLLLGNCIYHPTVMMRRDSVAKLPDFPNLYEADYIYAEDYRLWTKLAMAGLRFANIQEVLMRYRMSEGQNTTKFQREMSEAAMRTQGEYVEFYMEKLVEENETLCVFLNELVSIHNNEVIDLRQLVQIVYALSLKRKS